MALPKWPSRLEPPQYSPFVSEPMRQREEHRKPLTVWTIGIRILLLLTALIAAVAYWQL